MREIDVRKTQFSVADFLSWQKDGTLNLKPYFQRRSVWKAGAKSYFVDTVVRGLPAPIIYLRQRIDLASRGATRDVVDGQQRLRTIISYIDPSLLEDYDPPHDDFEVRTIHNKDIAGLEFGELSRHHQKRILEYEFSTHVLPVSVEDREVLEIFARLNATGEKLNPQELRNAGYFGEMKTLMYELAREQLERWTTWEIFSDDQISRMKEVELCSDFALNMIKGLTGKTQDRLNKFYKEFDDKFVGKREFRKRFRQTMDQIDDLIGEEMFGSIYTSEVHFFTLFLFIYDTMYGLGTALDRGRRPRALRKRLRRALLQVGSDFLEQQVPDEVLDAVRRASADLGRRQTRLNYMAQQCNV